MFVTQELNTRNGFKKKHYKNNIDQSFIEIDFRYSCTNLVLPVVLLAEPQDPVAEAEDVLIGGVPRVVQLLDLQERFTVSCLLEGALGEARILKGYLVGYRSKFLVPGESWDSWTDSLSKLLDA